MSRHDLRYVDTTGQPLDPQMHATLHSVAPQLRRDFPTLVDPCVETEVLETTGQLVADRLRRLGPLERLHAYTLTVARRLAWKRLRRTDAVQTTADPSVLERLPAVHGTAEQTEAAIIEREWFQSLSADEQTVYRMRGAGYTIKEIAERQRTTVGAVTTVWRRVKRRLIRAASPLPIGRRAPVSGE
jgi:RNA polymerase sigma factor (sigma-70 family)